MRQHYWLVLLITGSLVGLPGPARAEHQHNHKHDPAKTAQGADEPVAVAPNQLVVDVNGVVCSICAYGLEKRLSKMPFLDGSKFKNGVLTDIYRHHVTLALAPDKPVDFSDITKRITDGGYTPVTMFIRLSGPIAQQGDRYVLTTGAGQAFELRGQGIEQLAGQAADLQGRIEVRELGAGSGQPVPVTVQRPAGAS